MPVKWIFTCRVCNASIIVYEPPLGEAWIRRHLEEMHGLPSEEWQKYVVIE
ncbi:MAG: hypothetical protein QXP38_05820 [Nitrososphaerota archaeon]